MQEGNGDADKDERYTPPVMIAALHKRWGFTIDVAATPATPSARLIGRHWAKADDGLSRPWSGERVWCNPPFSSLAPWIEKAWASSAVVVMLIPANRTEQPFWQEMIEPYRDKGGPLHTEFIAGRTQFGTPESPDGADWNSSPPFGCVLLQWVNADRDGPLCYRPPQLELIHR